MPRQGLLFELLKKYISAVCLENLEDFIDFVPELYDVLSFFSCCPGRRWQAAAPLHYRSQNLHQIQSLLSHPRPEIGLTLGPV